MKTCNDYEWLLVQPAEREGENIRKKHEEIIWTNVRWISKHILYPDTYYNVIIKPGKKALQLRKMILLFLGQHPPHGIEHLSR